MDFSWTEKQLALYEEAVAFGRSELSPKALAEKSSMRAIWAQLAEIGATGLNIPSEYGGKGLSALDTARVLEGLGYGAGTTGHLFGLCAHLFGAAAPLMAFGDEAQKKRWLPGLAGGSLIGALAVTEPGAGSSPAEMVTQAILEGDSYRLNGEKCYITNAPYADLFVVSASTDPQRGAGGLSSFVIESGTEGIEVAEPSPKMGLYPAEMSQLLLSDCRVQKESRLSEEGRGSACFGEAMLWERALILAPRIGALRHHLDACVEFARDRRQGGRRIGHYQGVSHRIAKMAVKIEAAQSLLYRAAWSLDHRKDAGKYATMAKYFIGEVAVEVHLDVIQVFGGRGYLQETGVEGELRDAVGGLIHSGTAEMQLNIIAGHLGL